MSGWLALLAPCLAMVAFSMPWQLERAVGPIAFGPCWRSDVRSSPLQVSLEASRTGTYNSLGQYNPEYEFYVTGVIVFEFRGFFIFPMQNHTEHIGGATITFKNPSPKGLLRGQRLYVGSVRTPIEELLKAHDGPLGVDIFKDLVNGTVFGVEEASEANPFTVRLNSEAVWALNEARGNRSIALTAFLTPVELGNVSFMFGMTTFRNVYLEFEASASASPTASVTPSISESSSATSSISSSPSVTPSLSLSSSPSRSFSSSRSLSSSATSSSSRSSSPSSTRTTTPSPSTSPPYVRFGPVSGAVAYFGFDTPQACREFFILMGDNAACNTSLASCSFANPKVTFNNICDIPLSVLRQVPINTYNFYVGPPTPLGICAPPFDFHGYLCLGLDYANVLITHKNTLTCRNDVAFLGSMDATVTEDCASSFDIFVTGEQQPVPFGTLSNITNLEFLSFVVHPSS